MPNLNDGDEFIIQDAARAIPCYNRNRVAPEETTPQVTQQQEEGTANRNGSRYENGKFLAGSADDLRSIVLEEAQYLERLSQRIEALVESQTRLSRRIEIYIKALGIFPSVGRGIAAGFGVFLGATIVAGLFVYALSKWEAVPVIGEFVKQILEYIQKSR
jgi:hypothetical protein